MFKKLCFVGSLCVSGVTASAATLDFTEINATGIVATTVIDLSNATITSFGDDVFLGAPGFFGESNGLGIICASPAGNDGCEEDMQIDFDMDVEDLTFGSFGASGGDLVEVTAFLDGTEVGSVSVTTNTSIDFTAFGAIDSLFFADASSQSGIGFGDFSFSAVALAPVPLPAGGLMLAMALGGVGYGMRRNG